MDFESGPKNQDKQQDEKSQLTLEDLTHPELDVFYQLRDRVEARVQLIQSIDSSKMLSRRAFFGSLVNASICGGAA